MVSDKITDTVSAECGGGWVIEYSPAFMEEVRQHAVTGFNAFGRGGLEIGGVLYGQKDGNRLTVDSLAEFPCEHARGPGFLLSDKDHAAFPQFLAPPEGLETIGWFRTHTRKGLDLDAGDLELFDQFSAGGTILALVFKPAQVGPSSAAFYVRLNNGEILPHAPSEFAVVPAARHVAELPEPAATELTLAAPRQLGPPAPLVPQPGVRHARIRHGWPIALGAVAALATVGLVAYGRYRPSPDLGLQAYSIAPGQVRIAWNHDSFGAADNSMGMVEIHDGAENNRIPLNASQLRFSSITYSQKTDRIQVRLRIERSGGRPAEEWIEFLGPPGKYLSAASDVGRDAPDPTVRRLQPVSKPVANSASPPVRNNGSGSSPATGTVKQDSPESARSKRKFELPAEHTSAVVPAVTVLPTPPVISSLAPQQPVLPDFFAKTPVIPPPGSQAKPASRSGRLIWTGKLGRHDKVEIEGAWTSIGSLSGSLPGAPADFRIAPAEFTKEGLAIYTVDGAAHGRTEPPSKSNGWNPVVFEFDPVRAGELVVMEAPSRVNRFNKIVLRNDSRTCSVIVVDWTTR